jgi:hypothetical protein
MIHIAPSRLALHPSLWFDIIIRLRCLLGWNAVSNLVREVCRTQYSDLSLTRYGLTKQ